MKDFEIYENTFTDFEIGIKTSNTYVADVKSIIAKNIFINVKTALDFNNDNHTKLDVKCNRFDKYKEYAIRTTQTILQDQGSLGEGTGNEYISASTKVNSKFNHNGNNVKYYYDPSKPATDMNVVTLPSQIDRTCYSYSFDTSGTVAARIAQQTIAGQETMTLEERETKKMDVVLMPNPTSGLTTTLYSLGEEQNGEMVVMNAYGQVVDKHNLNSESNKLELDYRNLANGIYFISVSDSKGNMITKKMIIAK